MQHSTKRILTTHVGSLARPPKLIEMMIAQDKGEEVDPSEYQANLKDAVEAVVCRQVEIGVDIVDDGEFSKRGFAVYAHERLGGLEPTGKARQSGYATSRDAQAFPEFYAVEQNLAPYFESVGTGKEAKPTASNMLMACTGPLTYKGEAQLERDLANLRTAVDAAGAKEAFVPSISPVDVAGTQVNKYYASDEELLFAIGDAMNVEYKAIVDAGFVLQIDDPRLVNFYIKNPQLSLAECRAWAENQVEAINHSLKGIPEDQVRYHTCYGINMAPRVYDMEMKDYIDIVLKINAGAYLFEAANLRHEHEWRLWEEVKLPKGKSIIPGVITHSSVLVEHPELVAERIMRFASVVGRENVMAGSDCGFATMALTEPEIHPTIVWAKFQAMADGAAIASKKLWA